MGIEQKRPEQVDSDKNEKTLKDLVKMPASYWLNVPSEKCEGNYAIAYYDIKNKIIDRYLEDPENKISDVEKAFLARSDDWEAGKKGLKEKIVMDASGNITDPETMGEFVRIGNNVLKREKIYDSIKEEDFRKSPEEVGSKINPARFLDGTNGIGKDVLELENPIKDGIDFTRVMYFRKYTIDKYIKNPTTVNDLEKAAYGMILLSWNSVPYKHPIVNQEGKILDEMAFNSLLKEGTKFLEEHKTEKNKE